MKLLLLTLCVLTFSVLVIAQTRPIPRGIREADQVEAQTQHDIPPPINTRSKIDAQQLQRDADELAVLAQSIPSAIDQTTKGAFPKDLTVKLKRIEKLAKQLRNTLNPQ